MPVSNICEQTFSRARLFMNHLRAHMDPKSLEELLFLYFNQELWANDASVIDKAIAWDKRKPKPSQLLLLLLLLLPLIL